MKNKIKLVLVSLLFTTFAACSETKEVKIEDRSAVSDVDPNKDVNVNVKVDQAGQAPVAPIEKDTTNVIVKNESSKQVEDMNANLIKLQEQLKTANAQTKADINKQIQQMNADKAKLQQQVSDLQNQAKKAEANKMAQENLVLNKEQYKDTATIKLENLNTKITGLRTKAESLSDPSKTTMETEVVKLEDKRSEIETKLGDIDIAKDVASFKTVKLQVDNMITDLDKKYTVLSAKPELR